MPFLSLHKWLSVLAGPYRIISQGRFSIKPLSTQILWNVYYFYVYACSSL